MYLQYHQARLELNNTLEILFNKKPLQKLTEVKVLMVALVHSNWNTLLEELSRWKTLTRGGILLRYSSS